MPDAAVRGVVTRLAVQLVVAADVDGPDVATGQHGEDLAEAGVRGQAEELRVEVRAAPGVVELRHAAHHELRGRRVVVVVEGDVLGHRADVGVVRADDAHDVPVVADERVRVARVLVRRADHRVQVARDARARATEQQVRAVRPLVARREAEHARAAADDVVLAEAAEGDVVARAALDVVVAVGRGLVRRVDRERPDRVAHAAGGRARRARRAVRGDAATQQVRIDRGEDVVDVAVRDVVDRAVALDRVVAELAEEQIVVRAAGDVVVAERADARQAGVHGRVLVQVGDRVLGPPRHAGVRAAVIARGPVDEQLARVVVAEGRVGVEVGAAVQAQRRQRLEPQAGDVAVAPRERDVVAEDEVVLRAAVDRVVTGATDEDVAGGVAVDPVRLAVLQVARLDVAERGDGSCL